MILQPAMNSKRNSKEDKPGSDNVDGAYSHRQASGNSKNPEQKNAKKRQSVSQAHYSVCLSLMRINHCHD